MANNLLSPNAALEQLNGQHGGERRKSILSANGYFIDYSCTRRRSSAAVQSRSQFPLNYIGPAKTRESFCAGATRPLSQPSSPSRSKSRPSCASYLQVSPQSQSGLLFAGPSAFAGSRKTSIFDPAGHSLVAQVLARRKSTAVSPTHPVPRGAMLSAAKGAALGKRRSELVGQVPVIGCSPTSIRASLAALDETRRYEKLLSRLKRHQLLREKRLRRRERQVAKEMLRSSSDDPVEEPEPGGLHSVRGLRRKSIRAIKDAASLLRGQQRDHSEQQGIDGLSISSMSFASVRSSLPTLDRYEIDHDELFVDENTMVDFTNGGAISTDNNACQTETTKSASNDKDRNKRAGSKKSLLSKAIRKLAATISSSSNSTDLPTAKLNQRQPRANRSVSIAGDMNYWYYYYYYLRENSVIDLIDDLPISAAGAITESERRMRLYINYSLARIRILNSSSDPSAELVDRIARVAEQPEATSPISDLFNFDQSTDVSLTLSSSSTSSQLSESTTSGQSLLTAHESAANDRTQIAGSLTASSSIDSLSAGPEPKASALAQLSCSSLLNSRRGSQSVDCDDYHMHLDQSPIAGVWPTSGSGLCKWSSTERRQANEESADGSKLALQEIGYSNPWRQAEGAEKISPSNQFTGSETRSARRASGRARNSSADRVRSMDDSKHALTGFIINDNNGKSNDNNDNEKELDDFERFKGSYRGYKPGEQHINPPAVGSRYLKGRNSSFRLSVKSARGSSRRESKASSRSCLSWDTLNVPESAPALPVWDRKRKLPVEPLAESISSPVRLRVSEHKTSSLRYESAVEQPRCIQASITSSKNSDSQYNGRPNFKSFSSKEISIGFPLDKQIRAKSHTSISHSSEFDLGPRGKHCELSSELAWSRHVKPPPLVVPEWNEEDNLTSSCVHLNANELGMKTNKIMKNEAPKSSPKSGITQESRMRAHSANDKRMLLEAAHYARQQKYNSQAHGCSPVRIPSEPSQRNSCAGEQVPVLNKQAPSGDQLVKIILPASTTPARESSSTPLVSAHLKVDKEPDVNNNCEQNTKDLLHKSSFICLLLGDRQSGKRTIVKCFVKLLNEFKLATDQYRKEKLLTKLIDCSEKLQDLTSQQENLNELDRRMSLACREPRVSCSNWPGSGAMNRLLRPSINKGRRLTSVTGAPSTSQTLSLRRNTTYIDPSLHQKSQSNAILGQATPDAARDNSNFLSVHNPCGPAVSRNKSDFDISYHHGSESIPMTLLQAPEPYESRRGSTRSTRFANIAPDLCLNDDAPMRSRISSVQMNPHRQPLLSLKELNKRRIRIKFKTRRHLSENYINRLSQHDGDVKENRCARSEIPDSILLVYSINDRQSFNFVKFIVNELRSIEVDNLLPIILVANKIDLERAKVVESHEGRNLARKNRCKFIEISCTVGFNLDNLLVGIRTQLILKHHIILNSIFRHGRPYKVTMRQNTSADESPKKEKGADNILVRFYKRYVMDNCEQNYECENFSKL